LFLLEFSLRLLFIFCVCCFETREAMKHCDATQRQSIVQQLGALLCQCSGMLGQVCSVECLAALFCRLVDEYPIVRATAQQVWLHVKNSFAQSNRMYKGATVKILDGMSAKFLDIVKGVTCTVLVSNDAKMKEQLTTLLGISEGIKDHLLPVVRSSGKTVISCACALFTMEAAMSTSAAAPAVLENRNYCYTYSTSSSCTNDTFRTDSSSATAPIACASPLPPSPPSSPPILPSSTFSSPSPFSSPSSYFTGCIKGGYYRTAWRFLQDETSKRLAGKFALFIGRHGTSHWIF
jgi:hypothetical protein